MANPGSSGEIAAPKGGGALHGIGEKFSPDLHTGTGNFTIPLTLPPGRNGFQPQLSLVYSTGHGNGPFGLGWTLSIPGVSRKTSKGVPRYDDARDVFILSGTEDLVPVQTMGATTSYRPRTEGLFARILYHRDSTNSYWEVRTKDGLLSIYGTQASLGSDPATISDPAHRGNVCSWKLSRTEDPFGNRIEYEHERDTGEEGPHHWDQLYLKRIRYADYGDNRAEPEFLVSVEFLYEPRPDPCSDYRSGFEIRTRKRCTAIVVHTNADEDQRVRTYALTYLDQRPQLAASLPPNEVSLLSQVTVTGHDGDKAEALPPLGFQYTTFDPNRRGLFPLRGSELPARSLRDPDLELVDLFGNGLPDLMELNGTVRYWRNLGGGSFDIPRFMQDGPAGLALSDAGVQFVDANGDGRTDLVVTNDTTSGYFPLSFDGRWDRRSFQRHRKAPGFSFEDPEVKLVDLDGDGVTDAIRSGSRLECFFNDPDEGWNNTRWVERKALAVFPNVDFSDPRVKWGDFTGDGLQDIAVVHDGTIEYWPNVGRGEWGSRVRMEHSPRFISGYDPRRILIGDVDGDGLADLVYVDDTKVTLWINQSGNGWSEPITIHGTPSVSDIDAVRLVDVLGSGISGVLWSRDASISSRDQAFFLDFTGGLKPYLLSEMDNHIGAVTRVAYAPSTRFYVEDQRRPETRWKTTLPFPVHVVSRVEVIDCFSRGKLTTEYRYHHGHWDGAEREFRGFGMVEQADTESFAAYDDDGMHGAEVAFSRVERNHFSAPTLKKTWFHQGPIGDASGDWHELDRSNEYWTGDPLLLGHTESVNQFLGDWPSTPDGRRIKRDALRSLRGSILRTELYSPDGSDREDRPYTVTESGFGLVEIEPPPVGEPARLRIFYPHGTAQRTTQWERGDDPMTQFSFTRYTDENQANQFDPFGRPLAQTQVACPRGWRKIEDQPADPFLASRTVTAYARPTGSQPAYIHMRTAKATSYDVANAAGKSVIDIANLKDSSVDLEVIAQSLSYYDGPAFIGLPLGQVGPFGAITRTENLILTDDVLKDAYGTNVPPYLEPTATTKWNAEYPTEFRTLLPPVAGYVFHPGSTDPADLKGYFASVSRRRYDFQSGAARARGLVLELLDPLHNKDLDANGHRTLIDYDGYQLLPETVTDAAGLTMKASYDYRVVQAAEITDPNGNRSVFTFSPLGLLTGCFVRGQLTTEGDQSRPGARMEYGFRTVGETGSGGRQPIFVRSIRQIYSDTEIDVSLPERDKTIITIEYSDGFGRLLQTRTQGEDVRFGDEHFGGGETLLPANQSGGAGGDQAGRLNTDLLKPNVVVSGWQTYDNKGKVVAKYEPFFAEGWEYAQPGDSETGQKVVTFYDPRGYAVRTLNPDGSEQRMIFGMPGSVAAADLAHPELFEPTPWKAYKYDANDNAGRTHPPLAPGYQHYLNTPSSVLVDALGRPIEVVNRNRDIPASAGGPLPPIEESRVRTTYDIRGNALTIIDAAGREALRYAYDCANRTLRTDSIDAGLRRSVLNAMGGIVEQRDSKGALTLYGSDPLNRPLRMWARDGDSQQPTLRERLEYGDGGTPNQLATERMKNRAANRLGKVLQYFDEAGLLTFDAYDFKGNVLQKTRAVVRDAAVLAVFAPAPPNWQVKPFRVDWTNPIDVPLDTATFTCTLSYDALGRVKRMTYPQDLENKRRALKPQYNRAGALDRVVLDGETFVDRIAYNAKGQRVLIAYGNGIMTRQAYDPRTLRLVRMRTESYTKPSELVYRPTGEPLQESAYQFDLEGNIGRILERSPGCGIHNTIKGPDALDREFSYDALYRLRSATGRECERPPDLPWTDSARCADVTKARSYDEHYEYDLAGNVKRLQHSGAVTGPSRVFALGAGNNRLLNVTVGATVLNYDYDSNGNMLAETSARHFEWDHADRLKTFRIQTAGSEPSVHAQYLYDAAGQRVKKVVRKQGGQVEVTVYIDGVFEYHRIAQAAAVQQNSTLHVMSDQSRVAMVRVGVAFVGDTTPPVKYHVGDHLGSSNLVIDRTGILINREEHTPYGETSFGSFARKRYRFTGKERDEESGLTYHGARYYAPWLGRWTSCDPAGTIDGINLSAYVRGNPVRYKDRLGTDSESSATAEPGRNTSMIGPPEAVTPTGPNFTPLYPAGESALASHESGLIWSKSRQPDFDLTRVQPPKEVEAVLAPCFSDSPRAIGAPVGDCRGVVAMAAAGAAAPAAAVTYEAMGAAGLRISVQFPRAVAVGTAITAGLNGTSLPSLGSAPRNIRAVSPNPTLLEGIDEIGVLGNNNCFNRALAVDRHIAGSPTSALGEFADDVTPDRAESVLREIYPNTVTLKLFSKFTIERTARSFGEGTRGIVAGISYGKADSHAFNVVVTDGNVRFIDLTLGRPSFSEYSEFVVFFTKAGSP